MKNLVAQAVVNEIETPDIEWSMLSPFLVVAVGGILLITVTSVVPRLRTGGFPAAFTILSAAVAGWFLRGLWSAVRDEGPRDVVAGSLAIDGFTVFVWGVLLASLFLVGGLMDGYLRRERFDGPDWYVLLMMSAAGGMLLAAARDLILIFVGLEILSIAVYVLAGLHLRRSESQEAAFKYFILGAVASALMLYGIALAYGATGSTNLEVIAGARAANAAGLNPVEDSSMILAAMALLMVGFAFKISAVPFHMWTPDVYQGSPTPVVAFMASAVKVAGFAGMVRVFWDGFGFYAADWRPLIAVLAIASLVLGSFLALAQTNIKRMLAYSSITHAGFMLIAVNSLAGGADAEVTDSAAIGGAQALLFYMLAYAIMVIGSFGVLTAVGSEGRHTLDDYRGMAKSKPLLAAMFAVLLFAQAGVPFTSGFAAKFRVILAAANTGSYVLAGIAMLAAVVSAVLYLRVVVSMFMTSPPAVAHAIGADADSDVDADAGADSDRAADVDPDSDVDDDSETEVDPADDVEDVEPMVWGHTPRPALAAIAIAAVATILLGIFPIGTDVLWAAARDLAALR